MIYAGIGSRTTPKNIKFIMCELAERLEDEGHILRSGGAIGADTAFEHGIKYPKNKQIFYASNNVPFWCFEKIKKYIPKNRPPFEKWKSYAKKIVARNMQIFFGNDFQTVDFVICWTPFIDYTDAGGTGYILRCAHEHNIPIYNLYIKHDLDIINFYLENKNLLFKEEITERVISFAVNVYI